MPSKTAWENVHVQRAELHQLLDENPDCHLAEHELCCHDADETPYPERRVKDGTLAKLVATFESIRKACGGLPIRVDSAYRTPEHNAKVGGGKRSQHLQGRALDLRPPHGMSVQEFHDVIWTLADSDESEIGGIGWYDTFVHVDIRPRKSDGDWASWDYRTRKQEHPV